MKQYLIQFDADYYCQGMERGTYYLLVSANSYVEACEKILSNAWKFDFENPRNFDNLTLE